MESDPLVPKRSVIGVNSDENFDDAEQSGKPARFFCKDRNEKLGMVRGVILPTTLNIFGVILFLRLGLVVGQCGVWGAVAEFVVAYGVTILTSLSISAICTNGKVGIGGAYYMLSRSIGPEIGGSCGIVFWLGAVAGGCTYIMGFAESLTQAFPEFLPDGKWWRLLYGVVSLTILFVIVFIGAQTFADANLLIFVVLIVAMLFMIVSYMTQRVDVAPGYTSWSWDTFVGNFKPRFGPDPEGVKLDAMKLFGIMFPACTGIMAGINLSGDLKEPKRDIPKGTLIAVGGTFVSYIFLIFVLAFTCKKEALLSNYALSQQVSYVPLVVSFGVFSAALSSCLSNMIGASRVLQSVAEDELLPFIKCFAWGCGKTKEPRLGVFVTYLLMLIIIVVVVATGGDLNVTAPYATQFHIIAYGFTNFACFALKITGAPNFRPLFKYWSWHTALAGTVLCVITGILCDTVSAIVSCVVLVFIMVIIHFYAKPKTWGHITQALIYHQVRKYLLKLDERKDNTKFWRFQPLLLVANPRSCVPTILFMNNLKKGGTFIVGNVKLGQFLPQVKEIKKEREAWLEFITETKVKAFPEIAVANSIREGAQNLMMIGGIGAMKPNGIILGFFDPEEKPEQKDFVVAKSIEDFPQIRVNESKMTALEYVQILQDAVSFDKSVLVARGFHNLNRSVLIPKNIVKKLIRVKERCIDLWFPDVNSWENHSVVLTLQLGFMINRVDLWNKYHTLRVFCIVPTRDLLKGVKENVREVLKRYRINAQIYVVCADRCSQKDILQKAKYNNLTDTDKFSVMNDLMLKFSTRHTSFIFSVLPPPPQDEVNENDAMEYLDKIKVLTDGLPPMLLIHGSKGEVISLEL